MKIANRSYAEIRLEDRPERPSGLTSAWPSTMFPLPSC